MKHTDKKSYMVVQGGDTLCRAHAEDFFPTAWNMIVVNGKALAPLLKAEIVWYDDAAERCDVCVRLSEIPNSDQEHWTQAWVEVSMLISAAISVWVVRGGGTGQAGLQYNANKPYPTFDLFVTQDRFESELRHQCYIVLGRYHIKASDHKGEVRRLISRAYRGLSIV